MTMFAILVGSVNILNAIIYRLPKECEEVVTKSEFIKESSSTCKAVSNPALTSIKLGER